MMIGIDVWVNRMTERDQLSLFKERETLDRVDFVSLAELYAEVFAGPPWNEVFRCNSCQCFFGNEHQLGLPCPSCARPLSEAYPLEESVAHIKTEVSQENGTLIILKPENRVVGFAWGYSISGPAEFAQTKYYTPKMQKTVYELMTKSGITGQFFYFSECGIGNDHRGKGLSNLLSQTLLEVASESDEVFLLRTNYQSPMVHVSRKLGMEQIMGPVLSVDKETKIPIGISCIIEPQDTENNDRVLFVKRNGIYSPQRE